MNNIWIDENGNTCIGIKPEKKEVKTEPKKEEVIDNVEQKTTASNRRKRPRG